MNKRFTAVMLTSVLALTLTACSNADKEGTSKTGLSKPTQQETTVTEAPPFLSYVYDAERGLTDEQEVGVKTAHEAVLAMFTSAEPGGTSIMDIERSPEDFDVAYDYLTEEAAERFDQKVSEAIDGSWEAEDSVRRLFPHVRFSERASVIVDDVEMVYKTVSVENMYQAEDMTAFLVDDFRGADKPKNVEVTFHNTLIREGSIDSIPQQFSQPADVQLTMQPMEDGTWRIASWANPDRRYY